MTPPVFTMEIDDSRVMIQFDKLPLALKTKLRATITELTKQLLARVQAAEPRRTGRLRLETRSFVDDHDDRIVGRVRILAGPGQRRNIAAAALEYGAHRAFPVKGYYRRDSIAVSGYARRANIPAQQFLHGPARAMQARIVEALKAAVDKATAEASR